jgi:hypothetical protein
MLVSAPKPGVHSVVTATLVRPRTTPPASANSTKTRFVAGSRAIVPLAVAKIANVGVAPALICTGTFGPMGEMQTPSTGSVWQIERPRGRGAEPVLAEAVINPLAPTFDVATTNAADPAGPGMCRMPSLVDVAASATTSGTGVGDADISNVLIATSVATGGVLMPAKLNATSVRANAADGVTAMT